MTDAVHYSETSLSSSNTRLTGKKEDFTLQLDPARQWLEKTASTKDIKVKSKK
jgi:hypothetical protein